MEREMARVKPAIEGGPNCPFGRCCPYFWSTRVRAAHPEIRPLRDPRSCGFRQALSKKKNLRMGLTDAASCCESRLETPFQRNAQLWVRRTNCRTTEYRAHRRDGGDKREGV
jgi:hypothetical protein